MVHPFPWSARSFFLLNVALHTFLLSPSLTIAGKLSKLESEELIIDSPSHIDTLFKTAVKQFSEAAKDEELGTERDKWGRRKMGESCSKDEHCKDGERCSKIGRCRKKDSTVTDSCFYGFITCASEKGSPLRKRAEAEANNRLASTPSQEQQTLYHALLPGPAKNMMALPAPEGNVNDTDDTSSTSGTTTSTSITAAQQNQIAAIELVETVANGALTASGALPSDPEKWGKLATIGKDRVTRRPFYNYWDKEDRTWRLATEQLSREMEKNRTNSTLQKLLKKNNRFPTLHDKSMEEWFIAGGGKLNYIKPNVERKKNIVSSTSIFKQRRLFAEENIEDGDTIIEVPLKLVMNQLTCHQVKTQRGRYLGELFGGAISGKYSDWGLAGFLLVELKKGESSKWWPFIRNLKMRVMTTDVLSELENTYTGRMLSQWESEAEDAQKYLDKVIDHKDPMGEVKGAWSLRKDMRWALWVVRRHGIWVYKPKTLKKILSLVPFAHLLKHQNKAGGTVLMGLDKIIRVQTGRGFNHGEVMSMTYHAYHGSGKEGISDMEQLIRFHEVDVYDEDDELMREVLNDNTVLDGFRVEEGEEIIKARNEERRTGGGENDKNDKNDNEKQEQDDEMFQPDDYGVTFSRNPFNKITIALPGSKGVEVEDVFFEWTVMKNWRRAMKMPPKQSDLYRVANKLQLYGEEWDEEEQKIISSVNANIIKQLPYSVDMVPAEEQLMLLGHANTAEEASLILTGGRKSTIKPQLYSAPDPEEDERAARAIEEMADLMQQLQESVAAGSSDPSVLKVINESTQFFENGVQPKRGLDAVDKLLMRKKTLMDYCGNRSDHWANRNGVSKEMLCAVRIHMLNESDLDVVCPENKGAFWTSDGDDKRCEGGGFNWTLPISKENENATLNAVKQTLVALLSGFPSSTEDDLALLEEQVDDSNKNGIGPIRRNAIIVRARERRILQESISKLNRSLKSLNNMNYQITKVREAEQERKRVIQEKLNFKENARKEFLIRDVIVNVTINSKLTSNFTIREGDNIEIEAIKYCKQYNPELIKLNEKQMIPNTIVTHARESIRKNLQVKQIIFMFPIILSNGTRAILRMRQEDDGTKEVMKFCAVHNMTDRVCNWMRDRLSTHVESHFKDSVLATASIQAPDGRDLIIYLRQGDQHDLKQFVTDYVHVSKLPINVIPSITMMLERKLQPTVFEQSISGEGSLGVKLRLKRGDNAKEVVMAFGRRKGMPVDAQNQVLQALLQKGF
jgi:hypothetical protein